MKLKALALMALTTLMSGAFAQQSTMEAVRDIVDDGYNFWIYTPESYYNPETVTTETAVNDTINIAINDPSICNGNCRTSQIVVTNTVKTTTKCNSRKPVVIFLHGASLCGMDLYRVRRYGSLDAVKRGVNIDAIILAPQNPGGAWNPRKIMNILEWTKQNYLVDTNRVYVLGMSLGGYGTMDMAGTYPDKIAAAMALCGGTTLKDVSKMGELPFWVIHGTADRAVGISCSKTVVAQLEEQHNDSLLMYTWLKGASHSALARLFYHPKTYEWLFSHSLADPVRSVNRNFDITMDDIKHAYDGIRRDGGSFVLKDTASAVTLAEIEAKEYANCTTYTIQNGDTLIGIAKKTRTSVNTLCTLNNITPTTILRIGRKLKIKYAK